MRSFSVFNYLYLTIVMVLFYIIPAGIGTNLQASPVVTGGLYSEGNFMKIFPRNVATDPPSISNIKNATCNHGNMTGAFLAESVSDNVEISNISFRFGGTGALAYNYGERNRACRNTDSNSRKADLSNMTILPGDSFYTGVEFCRDQNLRCAFYMGRVYGSFSQHGEEEDLLSGSHGPMTGFHFHVGTPYGNLLLTPYHSYDLAGRYLITDQEAPPPVSSAVNRWHSDLEKFKEGDSHTGHRIQYVSYLDQFIVSLHYGYNQREGSRVIPLNDRPYVNRIEYSGLGIAYRMNLFNGTLFGGFSMERSAGYYRVYFPSVDRMGARMDGHALNAELRFEHELFSWELKAHLPEPATNSTGDFATPEEKSGYISYGDSMITSPILSEMDMAPHPELCREKNCTEDILVRTDEFGYRNHAALLTFRTSMLLDDYRTGLQLSYLRGLSPRRDDGNNPFERIKKHPGNPSYLETTIHIGKQFVNFNVNVGYSRLFRKEAEGKTEFAGEFYAVSLKWRAF